MHETFQLNLDKEQRDLADLRQNVAVTRQALPEYASLASSWMVVFRGGLLLVGLVFAGQSLWWFQELREVKHEPV